MKSYNFDFLGVGDEVQEREIEVELAKTEIDGRSS